MEDERRMLKKPWKNKDSGIIRRDRLIRHRDMPINRKSLSTMKVGDLVHYIKDAPRRPTDCGVFQRCFGLVLEICDKSNEAVIMTGETFHSVDISTVEVALPDSWFIKSAR